MHPDKTNAILMASGFSSRFGSANKLTQPFCGKPMMAHTLGLVCSLSLYANIYVVCASPEVSSIAAGYPVTIINNQNPSRGQRESIRLGVLPSLADYYHFFPCDQPLLDAATVGAVLAAHRPAHIIQPVHAGKAGNPVLFSGFFRQALLGLSEGQSGRTIKRRYPQSILSVEIPSPLPLADADTPDAFARLEKLAFFCEGGNPKS